MNKDIRWKQRFENLEKAYIFFKEVVEIYNKNSSSTLTRAALLHSFETAFELSWKTLKDFLEAKGYGEKTPRDVLKIAFQLEYIEDGHVWMNMLDDRNSISHVYDEKVVDAIANKIAGEYELSLSSLVKFFQNQND